MVTRPVYFPKTSKPFVDTRMIEFAWEGDMSAAQRRKNVAILHAAILRQFPRKRILEISSKSSEPLGVALSAFNLKKHLPELGRAVPVECIYQGCKVFEKGGPYTDLWQVTAKEAKLDPRLQSSGTLVGYRFDGQELPATPAGGFYDRLYISALLEHPDLAQQLLAYDAFTDIEFDPDISINCQAHAAALFVALCKQDHMVNTISPEPSFNGFRGTIQEVSF